MARRRAPDITTVDGLVSRLHRRYGEDIAQQALCVAYTRQGDAELPRLIRYAIGVARRLERWGFTDSKTDWGHEHCWSMEVVSRHATAEASWGSCLGNPLALAIAREALRALPAWVREWHLTDAFVYRVPCGHAAHWLYPRQDGRDKRVRCHWCDCERIAQHRAARRATTHAQGRIR